MTGFADDPRATTTVSSAEHNAKGCNGEMAKYMGAVRHTCGNTCSNTTQERVQMTKYQVA